MDFSKLTRYLDALRANYGIPAVDCKVTLGYDTVYRHSAGFADTQQTRPVADTDLYYVYSATKLVTATAALQLVEQNRLALTERLDHYLPEFSAMTRAAAFAIGGWPPRWPAAGEAQVPTQNTIRVVDLFRMTAGFSYDLDAAPLVAFRAAEAQDAPMRAVMEAIATMPLVCEPGTRWVYSLAHDVLGGLVERVTGERLGDYLRRAIFEPLGIRDMGFTLDVTHPHRMSTQYAADADTQAVVPAHQHNRYRLSPRYESGGAGLVCTVDAYSRFVQALANGGVGESGARILTMESIDLMRKNWLDARMLADFAGTGKTGYGYGLGVRTLLDATTSKGPVGEFGWDGAAGAYALIDPQNRLAIFLAEHVLGLSANYSTIHPTVRDLVYAAL